MRGKASRPFVKNARPILAAIRNSLPLPPDTGPNNALWGNERHRRQVEWRSMAVNALCR